MINDDKWRPWSSGISWASGLSHAEGAAGDSELPRAQGPRGQPRDRLREEQKK